MASPAVGLMNLTTKPRERKQRKEKDHGYSNSRDGGEIRCER